MLIGAAFGGFGPGALVTVLAALVGDYFFLSPVGTLVPPTFGHGFTTVLFLAQGLAISAIGAWLSSARQRAEASMRRARENEASLRRSEERHRFLAEASEMLSSSLDYRVTLAALARPAASSGWR